MQVCFYNLGSNFLNNFRVDVNLFWVKTSRECLMESELFFLKLIFLVSSKKMNSGGNKMMIFDYKYCYAKFREENKNPHKI